MKLVKILSILVAAGGLLLCVAEPILGIVFIIIGGILFFVSVRKRKEPVEAEPSTQQAPVRNKYITVAGFEYRQSELASLLEEKNEEYSYSAKKMFEEYLDRVYQFEPRHTVADLMPEPENEYDPNAIAVYVDGVKIGYVPKNNQADVVGITEADVEIYGGKWKEVVGDEFDYELETGETAYKASLTIPMQ